MKCSGNLKENGQGERQPCPHIKDPKQVGSCIRCPKKKIFCDESKSIIKVVTNLQEIEVPKESKICPPFVEKKPILIEEPNSKEKIVIDVVEKILWEKGGKHEPSTSSCCSSVSLKSDQRKLDNRLKYWKQYLADRQKIGEKIKEKTGKTTPKLLFNQSIEHRNVQLVKKILDYTERIQPTRLSVRKLLKLPDYECLEHVFETLPRFEKYPSKIEFDIVGVSEGCKIEQGVGNMEEKRENSWLNSKYLEKKIMHYSKEIHKLLFFYPDTDQLQICGTKLGQKEIDDLKSDTEDEECEWQKPCIPICHGLKSPVENKRMEYVIEINKTRLFVLNKLKVNLEFNFAFNCEENDKMKQMNLTFENIGSNPIDFEWIPKIEYNTKSLHPTNDSQNPSFFFDKNPFRLCHGKIKEFAIIFSSHRHGIYTEKWLINTDPRFCEKGVKIYVHLFGVCHKSQRKVTEILEIERILMKRANENMIRSIIKVPVPDPPPIHCYHKFFSDREIFLSLNPGLNCTQYTLECLENLYNDVNKHLGCPKWNYDLGELRQLIIDQTNSEKRKVCYEKFLSLLESLRSFKLDELEKPRKSTKFLKVRNILLAFIDKIVDLSEELYEIVLPTELDLQWNEVYLNNTQKLPKELRTKHVGDGDIINDDETKTNSSTSIEYCKDKYDKRNNLKSPINSNISSSSELSFIFVKSKEFKNKQKKLYSDSLYVQIYSLLSVACEEIAGVVEAQKIDFPFEDNTPIFECTKHDNLLKLVGSSCEVLKLPLDV